MNSQVQEAAVVISEVEFGWIITSAISPFDLSSQIDICDFLRILHNKLIHARIPLFFVIGEQLELLDDLIENSNLLRVVVVDRAVMALQIDFDLGGVFWQKQYLIISKEKRHPLHNVRLDLLELQLLAPCRHSGFEGSPTRSNKVENISLSGFAFEKEEGVGECVDLGFFAQVVWQLNVERITTDLIIL